MLRVLGGAALACALMLPVGGAPALASQGEGQDVPRGVGIRLLDAPVETADNPRARVYIIDHVPPGTTLERRIEVSYGDRSGSRISLYPGAASIDGGRFVGAEGRARNELTGWISLSPRTVRLGSGERATVDVEIDVPTDAARGERYGVIWAQASSRSTGGVAQVTRVGIRVYLSVGPGGAPVSDFDITSLAASRTVAGNPMVRATVRNTGRRALDLSAELALTDGPGALSAGPFSTDQSTTVGIGQSAPVTVDLSPDIPAGPWTTKLEVTSGLEVRTAEAELTFPRAPGATRDARVSESGTAAWWIGAAALVLATLAWWWLLGRRRSRRAEQALDRHP